MEHFIRLDLIDSIILREESVGNQLISIWIQEMDPF